MDNRFVTFMDLKHSIKGKQTKLTKNNKKQKI